MKKAKVNTTFHEKNKYVSLMYVLKIDTTILLIQVLDMETVRDPVTTVKGALEK